MEVVFIRDVMFSELLAEYKDEDFVHVEKETTGTIRRSTFLNVPIELVEADGDFDGGYAYPRDSYRLDLQEYE